MGFWNWLKSLFKKKDATAGATNSATQPPPTGPVGAAPIAVPGLNNRPEGLPATPVPIALRPSDLPASNHYASTNQKTLAREYAFLFGQTKITAQWQKEITRSVLWAKQNRSSFQAVAAATGVPWFVVAIINILEMGTNLNGTLLNGDPWNKKTVHFPSGLGPWDSWASAAIFAINHEEEGWHFNTNAVERCRCFILLP